MLGARFLDRRCLGPAPTRWLGIPTWQGDVIRVIEEGGWVIVRDDGYRVDLRAAKALFAV